MCLLFKRLSLLSGRNLSTVATKAAHPQLAKAYDSLVKLLHAINSAGGDVSEKDAARQDELENFVANWQPRSVADAAIMLRMIVDEEGDMGLQNDYTMPVLRKVLMLIDSPAAPQPVHDPVIALAEQERIEREILNDFSEADGERTDKNRFRAIEKSYLDAYTKFAHTPATPLEGILLQAQYIASNEPGTSGIDA